MANDNYITVQDVRYFLGEESLEHNLLRGDLLPDKEIQEAMKRSIREYNSVSPPVGNISLDQSDRLPADTNLFLDAITEQLYIAERARLTRQDFEYSGGEVTVNDIATRIKHLNLLIKEHKERWQPVAQAIKIRANLNGFFGQCG